VDNFINKIYNNNKDKIKDFVMSVNCAHCKGIKFIREELKFFAKTNIQSNNGTIFKTIVLINADYLTIDAQSALRRCIELFSNNTRFFIIVENKNKLLNPILSRFCEIYIPEYVKEEEIINLHQYIIKNQYKNSIPFEQNKFLEDKINMLFEQKNNSTLTHNILLDTSTELYEEGLSCLDLMNWIEKTDKINELDKSTYFISYDNIKSEYRCEKMLLFYMLDFIFLRLNKDVKCILEI
jgi:DNA polymerase III delta prime subunit